MALSLRFVSWRASLSLRPIVWWHSSLMVEALFSLSPVGSYLHRTEAFRMSLVCEPTLPLPLWQRMGYTQDSNRTRSLASPVKSCPSYPLHRMTTSSLGSRTFLGVAAARPSMTPTAHGVRQFFWRLPFKPLYHPSACSKLWQLRIAAACCFYVWEYPRREGHW